MISAPRHRALQVYIGEQRMHELSKREWNMGVTARRRGTSGLKAEFGIWLVLERKAGPQPHQANSNPFWTSEAGAALDRGCLNGTVLSMGTHLQTDVRTA